MYTSQKFNAVQVAELREKTRERLGQLNVFLHFIKHLSSYGEKRSNLFIGTLPSVADTNRQKTAFFLVVYIGVYISIAGNCAGYIGLTAMCWRCGTRRRGHHFWNKMQVLGALLFGLFKTRRGKTVYVRLIILALIWQWTIIKLFLEGQKKCFSSLSSC